MRHRPAAASEPGGAPTVRWRSSRLTPDERARAESWLSSREHDRLDQMTATPAIEDHRVESFLAGRLLLREIAAELTSREASEITIDAVCSDCGGPHGQPRISGSPVQLSLSRSRDLVVAAASLQRQVGVDVAARDASPPVLTAIGTVAGQPSLEHWTRVEAVLKADGRGLRVDPREVQVEHDGALVVATVSDRPARYRVDEIAVRADLLVSVAVEV